MSDLTITQKAACEAIWRAYMERNVDMTPYDLAGRSKTDARDLVKNIARYSNVNVLDEMTRIEVMRHGPLASGYGLRPRVRPSVVTMPTIADTQSP